MYSIDSDPKYKHISSTSSLLQHQYDAAEKNFLDFGLYYCLQAGKRLTDNQQKYLKKLATAPDAPSTVKAAQFTRFKDLAVEDISKLREIGFEYSPEFGEYTFNELLFELSQLLNEDILVQFRRTVGWVSAQKDWAIDLPESLSTLKYFNNKKKLLLDRLEDLEWQRACMFSEEDIKDISNLIGLNRGLSKSDKLKLAVDRQSLLDAIAEINEYDDRWDLLNTCSCRLTQGSKESSMK